MDYTEEQCDGLFVNILQQSKGIDNFFDCMFSFFRRKTDFFASAEESQKKVTEKYQKHKSKFIADKEREEKRKKKEEDLKKEDLKRLTPTVKEISAEEAERLKNQEKTDMEGPSITTNTSKPLAKKEESKGEKPNSGNGGTTSKYIWTQKLEDIQVNIPVDEKYVGKDFDIKYKAKTLFVGIKNGEAIINGEFYKPIKPDSFVWVLDSSNFAQKKMLIITFEKFDTMNWWDCVIKGDPVIDSQKINPDPSKLSDLDGETRKSVEKMMFDQRQKELGLPASDELGKYEKLQTFMKAHPDMDFSKAKFG